jgi:ABC-type Mn2+/Zn2+ transport system permease subunit
MMLELFSLYTPNLVIASIVAMLLAFLGVHLITRAEGARVLALTQQANFGFLMSVIFLGYNISFGQHVLALLLSLLVLSLFSFFEQRYCSKNDIWHFNIFLSFMAINYGATTFFPGLEGHMSRSFFGDIVTIHGERYLLMASVALLSSFYLFNHRSFMMQSFFFSLGRYQVKLFSIEKFLILITLVTSIFTLGFLFTLTFVFLPTTILRNSSRSLKHHYLLIFSVSFLSAALGLAVSLVFDRVASVPAMTICCLLLSFGSKFILKRQKLT